MKFRHCGLFIRGTQDPIFLAESFFLVKAFLQLVFQYKFFRHSKHGAESTDRNFLNVPIEIKF